MSNPAPVELRSAPWHLWLVGVLAVLWNSVGALDYVMTQTRNASYMSSFTPEQLEYFYGFPAWLVAAWAVSVWGGVLGSVLLLLRRRWAVTVFGVSLATMVITYIHNYLLTDGFRIMGGAGAMAFSTVIFVIGVALLLYARRVARLGVLR
ncbi:MAG: hypothetical protein IT483_04020 [Gammaproteobacteria bacterium]|nr:hypothetical protein [Gammaproteobacteria bacterium]